MKFGQTGFYLIPDFKFEKRSRTLPSTHKWRLSLETQSETQASFTKSIPISQNTNLVHTWFFIVPNHNQYNVGCHGINQNSTVENSMDLKGPQCNRDETPEICGINAVWIRFMYSFHNWIFMFMDITVPRLDRITTDGSCSNYYAIMSHNCNIIGMWC